MATTQQYSLRWNNYFRHLTYALDNHRQQDDFVDVSLCCDGRKIKAHKVVLSACSGYFKEIFKENPHPHPVIIFKFIKFDDLMSIVEFMYQGEVNVQQEALQSFLQTAELLAVQGLTAEEKEKPKAPPTPIIDDHKLIKTIPSTIRPLNDNLQTPITATAASTQTTTQTIEIPASALITQSPNQTTQIVTVQQQLQHSQQQQQQQHIQQQQQHHQTHHLTTNTITLSSPSTSNLINQTATSHSSSTVKKRKITFSDDDDLYTTEAVDDQAIVKTADMTFLRGTVKMDIPEYIVTDNENLDDGSAEPISQNDGTGGEQSVTQYTSEYEILTESEIEEKYHTGDNTEITIEMGRLLNQATTSSTQSNLDETGGSSGGVAGIKTDNKGSGTAVDPPLICKICNRKLQSANALRRHTASRHSEIGNRKEFECVICCKSFKTKWSLSTHNSRFHRDMKIAKECIKMEFTQ